MPFIFKVCKKKLFFSPKYLVKCFHFKIWFIKIEFYVYFKVKICIELNITNVKFHLKLQK